MAKLMLLFFGAVALFMAAVFGWIGWTSRARAGQALDLQPIHAETVAEVEIGTPGYVEGRLAERNRPRLRDFILYYRSSLTGFRTQSDSPRQPVWKPLNHVLPPLWIEVEDGEVQVFGAYSVTFQGDDPTWITTDELQPGVTERYEGLSILQPVTAIGRVAESGQRRGLEAEIVASGSFEDYVGGERGSASFGLIAAAVLGLAGLILIVLGILQ